MLNANMPWPFRPGRWRLISHRWRLIYHRSIVTHVSQNLHSSSIEGTAVQKLLPLVKGYAQVAP